MALTWALSAAASASPPANAGKGPPPWAGNGHAKKAPGAAPAPDAGASPAPQADDDAPPWQGRGHADWGHTHLPPKPGLGPKPGHGPKPKKAKKPKHAKGNRGAGRAPSDREGVPGEGVPGGAPGNGLPGGPPAVVPGGGEGAGGAPTEGGREPAAQPQPTAPPATVPPALEPLAPISPGAPPASAPRAQPPAVAATTRHAAGEGHAGAGGAGGGIDLGRIWSSVTAAAGAARPSVTNSGEAVRIIHDIPTEYRVALIGLVFITLLLLVIAIRAWRRSLRVERESLVDVLTGVSNRQAFERQLAAEWTRAGRYGRALGLLLLDIDGLKQVNDREGHAAGDAVLRRAAHSIARRVRESDTVARIGGDEFVVICPETPVAGLEPLADALERDFEQLPVGVSVGCAEREPTDRRPNDLLSRADAAMYQHKRERATRFATAASK